MGSNISKIYSSLSLFILAISLASCSESQTNNRHAEDILDNPYINDSIGYELRVPQGFSRRTDDVEGIYFGYAKDSVFKQMFVQAYDSINSACSPDLTGTSEKDLIMGTDEKTKWAKVSSYGPYNTPYPTPLCQPPITTEDQNPFNPDAYKGSAAYALCSERDGKTVVICISQMKDDPEMAKQIFESFRWTE